MLAVSLTDFSEANATALAKGCLAVVGGFVVGYVFGMLAAYGFDKFIAKRESPHGLHKVVRYTFGLIIAIIVALFMFRSGSGGDGNGGEGTGGGAKPGETTGTGTEPTSNGTGTPATKPDPTTPPKIQIVDAVIVKIFAGSDVEAGSEKYFQVGDESLDGKAIMVDLGGAKDRVRERVKSAKGRIVVVYEFAPSASDRTSGFSILHGAREQLGAPLVSPQQYRELLAKQP